METRGQIGLQSLGVCRACPETFTKCILPKTLKIDGKDGTNACACAHHDMLAFDGIDYAWTRSYSQF